MGSTVGGDSYFSHSFKSENLSSRSVSCSIGCLAKEYLSVDVSALHITVVAHSLLIMDIRTTGQVFPAGIFCFSASAEG